LEKYIKYLKISYKIEIIFGVLLSAFASFILGVFATDAPTSTTTMKELKIEKKEALTS
jgi:hypothetical protein